MKITYFDKLCVCVYVCNASYRIARNFRGLIFSRISLAQTFRDLIFEDCVRARRMLTIGKILEDTIFEVRH